MRAGLELCLTLGTKPSMLALHISDGLVGRVEPHPAFDNRLGLARLCDVVCEQVCADNARVIPRNTESV